MKNVGYGNAQGVTGDSGLKAKHRQEAPANKKCKTTNGAIAKNSLNGTYGKTGPLSRGPK